MKSDLDTQIEQVEQRLVAREAWVAFQAEALAQRAQTTLTPPPWLLPAAGSALLLWLGWRLLRRDPPPPVQAARAFTPAASRHPSTEALRPETGLANLPWAGMVALAWPLVPERWHRRISPAVATAAVSTALAIIRRLGRKRPV